MTTNHHTPIPSTPKQPANAATINAPLSQLDAEITALGAELTAQGGRLDDVESEMPVPSGNPDEFYNGSGGFSVPSGTGTTNGHTIQDGGVDLTQRAKLNFKGSAVTVTDTPTATEVEITASLPTTTAANDVVVGNGSGDWITKTLTEFLTIIGKADSNGLASLNALSKVVQDPANATATPTASKIPIADVNGLLDGWVSSPPTFTRVSVLSGVPNPTTEETAKTSVFVMPYGGSNTYQQWTGSRFGPKSFAELIAALNATYQTAGKVYDLYLFDDGGTVRAGFGVEWASVTSRGTGASSAEIATVNGVDVNANSMVIRNGASSYTTAAGYATLVGTIAPSTSGQLQWTSAKKELGNRYWLLPANLNVCPGYSNAAETPTNWAQTSAVFAKANGGSGADMDFVFCQPQAVEGAAIACITATGYTLHGIGWDSATSVKQTGYAYTAFVQTVAPSNNNGNPLSAGTHTASLLVMTFNNAMTFRANDARYSSAANMQLTYATVRIFA